MCAKINQSNSARLHTIVMGVVIAHMKELAILKNLESQKHGKLLKQKTPYILNGIPFTFSTF